MLNLNLTGNIGKDAVTRTTQGGDNVTSFTVAVNQGSGDKKRTEWVECALWGKRGDALAQYLTKGTTVSVCGQPRIRQYEASGEHRAQMQVSVSEISLHGGAKSTGEQKADWDAPGGPVDLDDAVPFAPEFR